MVKEAALKYNWISPEDYLHAERASEEKHEYFDGEVVVMQGASLEHNRIVSSILGEARNQLKGKGCEVLPGDMRTASPEFLSFTYPDATIICGKPQLANEAIDILQNPTVIFEVVSKSSYGKDFSFKLMYYRQIPSLREYVLIDSFQKIEVNVYRRNNNNTWTLETYNSLDDSLVIQSVGISLSLAGIYENVTLKSLMEEEGLI